MTPNLPAELDEPPSAPAATVTPALPPEFQDGSDLPELTEARGCLYAISQPPLMFFLAFIALLLGLTGAFDLLLH